MRVRLSDLAQQTKAFLIVMAISHSKQRRFWSSWLVMSRAALAGHLAGNGRACVHQRISSYFLICVVYSCIFSYIFRILSHQFSYLLLPFSWPSGPLWVAGRPWEGFYYDLRGSDRQIWRKTTDFRPKIGKIDENTKIGENLTKIDEHFTNIYEDLTKSHENHWLRPCTQYL